LDQARPVRAPAALAALAIALGVVLAARMAGGPVRALAVRGAAAVLLAVPGAVNAVYSRRPVSAAAFRAVDVSLLASLAVAGTIAYDAHHRLASPSDAGLLPRGVPLTVTARVVEVRPSLAGGARVVAAFERVAARPGAPERTASGLVWASWPDGEEPPGRGDIVEVSGPLEDPRGRRNPGAFDFAAYLRHRRILTVMRCEGARVVRRPPGVGRVQSWIAAAVERRLPGEAGTLMLGLLLGRTGELSDELMDAFRRSGTVHILSVSGLHVGFILLIAHALLRSARLPPKAARLLSIPCLVGFAVLIGPGAPVMRATAMVVIIIIARSMGRAQSTLNAVGVAAIGILALDPGSALDLGFQLSYGATLGIVLLYGPARRLVPAPRGRLSSRAAKLLDALVLSTSAQLAVAPTLMATTGQFTTVAPLANLVIVPLSTFAVAAGIAMLAANALPWLASLFAGSAWVSLQLLLASARLSGGQTWSAVPAAARFAPAAFLGVVALALCVRGGRPRTAGIAIAAGAAILATVLASTGPGRDRARVVFFDVGQGDAALLELPRRRYVLVDAGPGAPWMRTDAGKGVIAPYLRREAVTTLEAIVVTHGHDDHVGGAATVLRGFRVRTLVLPCGWERNALLAAVAKEARATGARVVSVARGDSLTLSGVDSLWVLGPPEGRDARELSENDASLVLRLRIGGARVLFTGDAGRRIDDLAVAAGDPLATDVLKVAHHGSPTSSTPAFIARAAAGIAVVSVGARNRYGHPDAGVLERLEASGARVFRTDRDGAIVLDLWDGFLTAEGTGSGRGATAAVHGTRETEGPTTTSE
jgi:competence protein ComEC